MDKAKYMREYRARNRARLREAHRLWNQQHAEHVRAYRVAHRERYLELGRQRYIRLRDQRREYWREYYLRNKDRIAKKNLTWCRKNREKRKAIWARYYAKHGPTACYEARARRRARIKGNGVEKYSREEIIRRDNSKCHICGKRVARKDVTLDHLIPISVGGPDTRQNVALAHIGCNRQRGAGRIPAQLFLIAFDTERRGRAKEAKGAS